MLNKKQNISVFLLICLCIFLKFWMNDAWIYNQLGHVDPWMYVGMGFNYFDPTFYVVDYKFARLPWVLLQTFYRSFLPVLMAGPALVFTCLLILSTGVFFLFQTLWKRLEVSLFLAVSSLWFFGFQGIGGWDYHQSLAMGLGMWVFGGVFQIQAQGDSGSFEKALKIRLLALGVLLGLLLHTNIFFLNFLPIILFPCFFRGASFRLLRHPGARLFWIVTGGVLVTFLLALIFKLTRGRWLFFMPLIKTCIDFILNPVRQKSWHIPLSQIFFSQQSNYLHFSFIFFLLAFVQGVFFWRRKKGLRDIFEAFYFPLQFIFVWVVWVFFQWQGQTTLQPNYFFAPVFIPGYLYLGFLVKRSLPSLSLVKSFCFAILVAIGYRLTPGFLQGFLSYQKLFLIAFLIGLGIFFLTKQVRWSGFFLWPFFLMFQNIYSLDSYDGLGVFLKAQKGEVKKSSQLIIESYALFVKKLPLMKSRVFIYGVSLEGERKDLLRNYAASLAALDCHRLQILFDPPSKLKGVVDVLLHPLESERGGGGGIFVSVDPEMEQEIDALLGDQVSLFQKLTYVTPFLDQTLFHFTYLRIENQQEKK